MADTRFDDATKAFNSLTSRRVTLGALLGGALGHLGRSEADAKKSKDGGGQGGHDGGGPGVGVEAMSGKCKPACGTCQGCTKGKCRTKNGKKHCKKGTCQPLSGTPCTPTIGGSGICHDGVCFAVSPSTNCK